MYPLILFDLIALIEPVHNHSALLGLAQHDCTNPNQMLSMQKHLKDARKTSGFVHVLYDYPTSQGRLQNRYNEGGERAIWVYVLILMCMLVWFMLHTDVCTSLLYAGVSCGRARVACQDWTKMDFLLC